MDYLVIQEAIILELYKAIHDLVNKYGYCKFKFSHATRQDFLNAESNAGQNIEFKYN